MKKKKVEENKQKERTNGVDNTYISIYTERNSNRFFW